jgi:hypothetical protein
LLDQAPQCQGISLVPNVPVGGPGELTKAGDGASLCHARQAEIEPISEERRHENPFVRGRLARPQMGEAIGEQRPSRNFRQKSVMRTRGSIAWLLLPAVLISR